MHQSQVIFKKIPARSGHIGLVTLNRPEALNALSGEMIMAMLAQLQTWADDASISLVLIQGAGSKAFCAGGDLKIIYNLGPKNFMDGAHFYEAEYKLNLLIHNYPKPYIAILDGIAMGGGLGISLHGTRVIATEKLKLAMPETAIGFFPDVGAGVFFQHSPHKIGMYLGLTGNTINLADAMYANLLHAYVPSNKIETLIAALTTLDLEYDAIDAFDNTLAQFLQPATTSDLQQYANIIEDCFSKGSVEEIIDALNKAGSEWALQQVQILNSRSPTSLKVTFALFNKEAGLSLPEALAMELKLTAHIMQLPDIYEGIRAILVEKTYDPKWHPATLQDVDENNIERLFS